jgi:hypothetical protein
MLVSSTLLLLVAKNRELLCQRRIVHHLQPS